MKKQLLISIGMLICISMYSQSILTPLKEWSTTAGTQYFFYKNVVKTVGDYTYIAGATFNAAGNYDLLVAKYDDRGVLEWIQQIDGDEHFHDFATAIDVNDTAVYVTGAITNDTLYSFSDMITLKLDITDGSVIWEETFDGSGMLYDCGADIMVDDSGFVYITGSGYNDIYKKDYITLRYNSGGTLLWNSIYEYEGEHDVGVKLIYDGGRLYVLGACQTVADTTIYDAVTIQINQYSGAIINSSASSGGSSNVDYVNDFTRDTQGNLYVAGAIEVTSEGYNTYVAKLDSNLVFQWEATFNGADDKDDIANGVKVDTLGNVYVAGYSTSDTQRKDWILIQYDNSGSQQWIESYNDTLDGDDEAMSLEINDEQEIIVTGYDSTTTHNLEYYTVKYDNSGTEIWKVRESSISGKDKALNMAIDNEGAIIITGESQKPDGSYQYKTIKYYEHQVVTPTDTVIDSLQASYQYYENRGQLLNPGDSLVPAIKYYTKNTGPAYFIGNNKFSFVFAKIDTTATVDTLHRVDVSFTNVNPSAKVYPMEEQRNFINYFLEHIPNGITEVYANNRLITPNLYSNVDLEYSNNQNGLKYYFVVKPGGIPSNIKLEFDGASSFNLDGTSNALTINTSIGSLIFARPTIYQVNSSNVIVPIAGWTPAWQTNGASNKYKFNIGAYDSTKVLVIKIDLGPPAGAMHINNPEWSMFFGGNGYDEGTGVVTDSDGNSYFTGFTDSNNFPSFDGMQPIPGGDFDAYISKFGSANGASVGVVPDADQQKWTTYYGGTGNDRALGISTIGNGATGTLFVTGYTEGGSFPTFTGTGNYNQPLNAGLKDAFIIKMDNFSGAAITGIPAWVTHFGGDGDEIGTCIKNDGAGSFYMGGSTNTASYSSTSCSVPLDDLFPKCTTSSPYNNGGSAGGALDGFITKFTNGGDLRWSSFYGGANDDVVNSIAIDGSNTLYFTGKTASNSDFPLLTLTGSGTIYNQATFGGGTYDAFLVKFNSSGTRQWSTFFGGDDDDEGFGAVTNSSGDLYIGGETSSATPACTTCTCMTPPTGEFPMCHPGGSYFQGTGNAGSYGGGISDGFLAKFDNAGHYTWGTYYGGSAQDVIKSVAIDYVDRLFYAGKTFSPASANIAQAVAGFYYDQSGIAGAGTSDAILGYFDASDARFWGTYYGKLGNQSMNSIRVYSNSPTNENWYITGVTDGGILTQAFLSAGECCPNAYFQYSSGGGSDAVVARFSIWGMYMVSVEDMGNNESNEALVYPNPASYNVTVALDLKKSERVKLSLYSITGQLLYTEDLGKQVGHITHLIDFSRYNNDIYILQIQTESNMISKKIIKHD